MGMKAVFDSNILIDFLLGEKKAKAEFSNYEEKHISIITWMEVLVGSSEDQKSSTLDFLNTFKTIDIDRSIAWEAISLRKKYKLKLPDAIVFGSATKLGLVLVTRNTKDFKKEWPGIRIPY